MVFIGVLGRYRDASTRYAMVFIWVLYIMITSCFIQIMFAFIIGYMIGKYSAPYR